MTIVTISETPVIINADATQAVGPAGPPGSPGSPGPEGPAGNASVVTTVAVLTASAIDAAVKVVHVEGYYSVGVGDFWVRRVAAQPSHGWKFRSTDRFMPDGSTDATNGGWWEGYSIDGRSVHFESFGARGDNSTDNYATWLVAYGYINATQVQSCGYELRVGPGVFKFSAGLVIDTYPFGIVGHATETPAGQTATWFDFAYGTAIGIKLDAAGAYCKNLSVFTNGGARTGSWSAMDPYVGIKMATRGTVEFCTVWNWPEGGIWISGHDGSGSNNTNNWKMRNNYCAYNGFFGIKVSGVDANAGTAIGCSTQFNGAFGYQEDSFLGNQWVGCHSENDCIQGYSVGYFNLCNWVYYGGELYKIVQEDPNTSTAKIASAQTTRPGTDGGSIWLPIYTHANDETTAPIWGRVLDDDGNLYDVINGQEANMWTSKPSTHPAVWSLVGPSAGGINLYIKWKANWKPYTYGNGYAARSINATSGFLGCYCEGSTCYDIGGSSWVACPGVDHRYDSAGAAFAGRQWSQPSRGIQSLQGGLLTQANPTAPGSGSNVVNVNINAGKSLSPGQVMAWSTDLDGDSLTQWAFGRDTSSHGWSLSNGNLVYTLYGPQSTGKYNGGMLINALYVGSNLGNFAFAGSAPTTGAHLAGEIVLNSTSDYSASINYPIGWRCVTAGTPGTWEALYAGSRLEQCTVAAGAEQLPAAGSIGRMRAVVDGAAGLAWGDTITGGSNVRYLVWDNGVNWTVFGK